MHNITNASSNVTKTGSSDLGSVGHPSKDAERYVGFANFPNQVFRRAIKNGFEFTLMVVGESGLGKSTFVNTLFLAEINDPKLSAVSPATTTVTIEQKHVGLVENGTTLMLNLVDTPGFGDQVDNSKCWEPIVKFVESRYQEYFTEETKIERKAKVADRCVHLCLYFIAPTGHGLKQLDVEFMKKLHEMVNIIPVIAKADCLTQSELAQFKAQIVRDMATHGINMYKFPEPEDEIEKRQLEPLRKRIPFAVVGSNQIKEEGTKKIRYREYAWGVVEVDNLSHNDFLALRDMVIRTNLVDLIEVTRNVHYENFRFRQMHGKPATAGSLNAKAISGGEKDPFTHMEEEKQRQEREMASKQRELDYLFSEKMREREVNILAKEQKINEREADLNTIIEARRAELERIRDESHDSHTLVKGSLMNSKVSLSNENGVSNKTSPSSTIEKTKVKKHPLQIFSRNN